MRRYEDAQSAYDLAARLAPEVPAVHRDGLRVRLVMTGDTVAAREYLEALPRNLNPSIVSLLEADLAYYRGDFQRALGAQGAQGPRGGRSHERLAILYHLMGNKALSNAHADSLRAASQAVLDEAAANPGPDQTGVKARAHAKLGIAYALLGQGFAALTEGFTAVSSLPVTVDAYEGGNHLWDLALAMTLMGETELALEQIETALSIPSPLTRADLVLDPVFRPLRDDPRFQELLGTVR
jgi:tetratricopeptide (TPR) repeat protein